MSQERGPQHLYPERAGGDIPSLIEVFKKPPEFVLSEAERAKVLGVEKTLTQSHNLNLDLVKVNDDPKIEGIENIYDARINSNTFYLDYFLTEEGKKRAVVLGVSKEAADQATTIDQVRENLLVLDYSKLDGIVLGDCERESSEFIQKRMVDAFEKNGFSSVDAIPNPTRLLVATNPDKLADKVEGLKRLKTYLKAYDATLTGDDKVTKGTRVMVAIHRRRVNEMIANLYPEAFAFQKQAQASNTDKNKALSTRIEKAMSGIRAISGRRSLKNFSRIDMFLNGAGELQKGNYNQVSGEILTLADEVTKRQEPKPTNYRYKGFEEKWKDAEFSAEEFRAMGEKVLDAWGILSSMPHTEYDPERQGRAPDGKWQAVLNPKSTSLSVESKQNAMKFQPNKPRKMASVSPAGAVPGLIHETHHVWQHGEKERLGLTITERVGMDRSALIAEGGGIYVEGKAQRELFGQVSSPNTDYLRAAQARIKGGGYADCVKAFYESQMAKNPNSDKRKVAELAADRTLRLFRSGGQTAEASKYFTHSGGGTLEYLEQELLAKELRGTPLEPIFYLTGVNLEMLAELHKIGLFDIKNVKFPPIPVEDIIKEEIEKKLAA